jgi:outer membrane protein OmpA-like peptidoglycan-associated protein
LNLPCRCLSVIALASILFCDAASPAVPEPGGSPQEGGAVVVAGIGAGVVIGTVALIELFHRKHTIRGCVTEGPDGLQIVDEKTQVKYILRGKEDLVQPGQTAAIRGRKKHKRHQLYFVVKNMRAEYGPCGQSPAMVAAAVPVPAPTPALQHRPAGGDVEASISATGSAALNGVEFDTNSATLRLDSETTLHKALAVIEKRHDSRWVIAGYTDGRGSAELNQRLSDARASSVRDWLVSHGAAEDRLTAHGYGASHFVADNETEEGRARNRRVELQLVK